MTSFKIRRTKINNDMAMSAPQAILCCKNSPPEDEGATHVNIFQNYCKITKNKCVARGGATRRETIISSPTGEARWGLARKGGVICYQ